MEDTYRFLRLVEHRLQTMFDRQTHQMPRDLEEQRILAIRIGYPPASVWEDRTGPAQRFLNDYRAKTELNRRILNHLLHDAFRDDAGDAADPVVDLVLDPDPDPEHVAAALGPLPLPRPPDGVRQPAGPGARGHPVPVAGAVPALPRGDRPAAAPGRRPDARPRHDADEPGEGLGLAGGQGDPLGAVQLQPADPPALRRALRLEPVPLRDPDQQPGDDRRPDGLAGRRPPAALLGDPGRAGRALPGGRGPGRRSCSASGTRSGCGSGRATSSAASRSAT